MASYRKMKGEGKWERHEYSLLDTLNDYREILELVGRLVC